MPEIGEQQVPVHARGVTQIRSGAGTGWVGLRDGFVYAC
jgi:hypothetical protein